MLAVWDSSSDKLLHPGRSFLEVSVAFVFEKVYPFVRCLFFWEFRKNSLTLECFTSGVSSCRDEVQPSVGMASPSRIFSTSRSSVFRFPLPFSSWIFRLLDLSAAAYPNRIGCTSRSFKIKKKRKILHTPSKPVWHIPARALKVATLKKYRLRLQKLTCCILPH